MFHFRLELRGDFLGSVVDPHYLVGAVEEKSSPTTGDGSIGVKVEEWSLGKRDLPVVFRIVVTLDLVYLSLCHENTVTTCERREQQVVVIVIVTSKGLHVHHGS